MKWDELTPRERDVLVAEEIMGWQRSGNWLSLGRKSIDLSGDWLKDDDPDDLNAPGLPHYTTDYNACRLVEDEIELRGLWRDYLWALIGRGTADYLDPLSWECVWEQVICATADQRCHAALKALGVEI